MGIGVCLVVVLTIIAYSPLATVWFHHISGLDLYLTGFTKLPVRILTIMPAMSVFITFQWGVLVQGGKTSPISVATVLEVAAIVTVLFVLTSFLNLVGITAAAIAFLIGRTIGTFYLYPHTKRQIARLT